MERLTDFMRYEFWLSQKITPSQHMNDRNLGVRNNDLWYTASAFLHEVQERHAAKRLDRQSQ